MRLRRSNPTGPGWHRRRRGRGFAYTDGDGALLTDPVERQRITDLVIPPAWRDVWVCPYPNGHIQAVGTDDAGRRQYLYHERWRSDRDEEKHERVLSMAPLLPDFRKELARAMCEPGPGPERVLATALHMLDRGIFRVGSESYAQDNGSHGVATLLRDHVAVSGSTVDFCFPAKSGIEFARELDDEPLARAVRSLLRSKADTDRLLVYRKGARWCEVRSDDLNERFKELVGDEYSVKDLRTWHATVQAAVAFASAERPESQRGRRKVEAGVMREVAEELGNTPAVARKSYVDPRVVSTYEAGRTIRVALKKVGKADPVSDRARAVLEPAVVRLLKRA
jgi:DNA topoisomerase IB